MPNAHDDSQEALSPAIRELLSVFENELVEVQFPNVSAKILTSLASQVAEESQRVEELRQQLEVAQNTLSEAQQKLVRTAELGLAYARVYAADDAALLGRLSDLQVGPNSAEAPKRRKLEVAAPGDGAVRLPAKRGRKPKNRSEDHNVESDSDTDATGT